MPCDAPASPASPDAEREAEQLLASYTQDAEGWWWGFSLTAHSTRITVYANESAGTGAYSTLRIEHGANDEELILLANNYLNLLKVQQSAT